ncbi:MAG: histidine phosphatase family protein [Azospirillaceae bacterium]|nr:histidine phosphatase family protein [Azospirillaceae bacterium]
MILLRHGQSEFNVHYAATGRDPGIRDAPLTEAGRHQARIAATRLAGRVDRLIASPYRRALETAGIIAEQLALPLTITALCGEHGLFSCDVGTPASQLAVTWPQWDFSALPEIWWPESGETLRQVQRRAAAFRTLIAGEDDHDAIAIISHWGFIRALTGEELPNCGMVVTTP